MRACARETPSPAAPPLRLFAIASGERFVVSAAGDVLAFIDAEAAQQRASNGHPSWRVVELVAIAARPERASDQGDGQFQHISLGPGVQAALRVTDDGRVRMLIPGGDIDITAGAAELGCGIHQASARAAQIRVRLEERASRRRAYRADDQRARRRRSA